MIRIPESKYDEVQRFISDDFKTPDKMEIEELQSQIIKYEIKFQETKSILGEIKELLSVKAQRNSAGGLLKNRDQVLEMLNSIQKDL